MSAILRSLHDTEEHLPTPVSAFLELKLTSPHSSLKRLQAQSRMNGVIAGGEVGDRLVCGQPNPQPAHFHCPPYHRGSSVVEKWIATLVAERKGKKDKKEKKVEVKMKMRMKKKENKSHRRRRKKSKNIGNLTTTTIHTTEPTFRYPNPLLSGAN